MQAVATTISAVTVYRNGALVTRVGKGVGDVEIRGLPLLFAAETLRVRPERGAVSALEETMRLDAIPAPLPVPEEQRVKLLLEIARIDDELRTCALLLEVLDGMMPEAPHPQAPADKLVDAKAFVELADFAAAEAQTLTARRQSLEKKRRELERERQRIDERAAAVPQEAPRVTRGARFKLEATSETSFALEYFVSAARWVPTYALHLQTASAGNAAQMRLVTAALVAQATGEDWSGAALAVCTADLARETTLPTLSSWRIGRAQQMPARAFRPLPTDLPSLFASYDQAPRKLATAKDGGDATLPPTTTTTPPFQGESTRVKFEPSADTGEVRSFEEEKSGASMSAFDRRRLLSDDADAELDEPYGGDMDEGGASVPEASVELDEPAKKQVMFGAKTSSSMRFVADMVSSADRPAPPPSRSAPMPMQAMPHGAAAGMMAPASPVAMNAPKSGSVRRESVGRGGGAPGRGKRDDDGIMNALEELPPRFRTAYMRMAGPDESRRGSLLPLDPMARLDWLLEATDVDGAGRAELRRAIVALAEAQRRLEYAPLPRGTSALLGTHFPSVLAAQAATDIPGDGTFYRVEVREDKGPAVTEHKAVPRESTDVWRTCRIEIGGAPLPPGPLAVYEDGAFKVNARLDTGAARVAGSGGVDINLGVDPDVRILSRTVHVNQSEKGIVTSTSRVEHRVKMEVRSTRKEPALVVLYDRLPTAADSVKDVTVQVIEDKPPIKKTAKDAFGNELIGGFEWRVTVMPGDTQKIDFAYAIDLPAKAELDGGNRRD